MTRNWLMGLCAALAILLVAAPGASALAMTINPGGSISDESEGEISFRGGPFTIRCPLTLRGSLSGEASFGIGEQFGALTGVSAGRCSGGTIERFLIDAVGRTWPLRIETPLPAGAAKENLTGWLYRIERVAFRLAVFGEAVRCLYEGTAGALVELTNRGEDTRGGWLYSLNRSRMLEAIRLAKIGGGELCPATGAFSGSFRAPTPAQTITVR